MIYSYYHKGRIKSVSFRDNLRFSIGKIKKLYPLHIFMMITALPFLIWGVIKCSEGLFGLVKVFGETVLNILLLQSWIPIREVYFSLNGVAWYLCVCVFLYFMFPWVLKFIEKHYESTKDAWKYIVILMIVQLLVGFITSFINFTDAWPFEAQVLRRWITYIFPCSRLVDFSIGCNLGYIFITGKGRHNDSSSWKYSFGEIAVILAIIIEMYIHVQGTVKYLEWWGHTAEWTITSCFLIYLFALNRGCVSNLLTNRVFLYIGSISAYTFLIHQMVIRYLQAFCWHFIPLEGRGLSVFILFASFLITVVSAEIWKRIVSRYDNAKR